jgi:hypothetical protein
VTKGGPVAAELSWAEVNAKGAQARAEAMAASLGARLETVKVL